MKKHKKKAKAVNDGLILVFRPFFCIAILYKCIHNKDILLPLHIHFLTAIC